MELTAAETDVLSGYLGGFATLAGDRPTAWLLGETVRGIIGSASLCCSRIAAFSPGLAAARRGEARVRRMVRAETTKRSTLDADALVGRLPARGMEQLRGEGAIWVLVDGSDLRKPHARAMGGCSGSSGCTARGWCRATAPSTPSGSGNGGGACCTIASSAAPQSAS